MYYTFQITMRNLHTGTVFTETREFTGEHNQKGHTIHTWLRYLRDFLNGSGLPRRARDYEVLNISQPKAEYGRGNVPYGPPTPPAQPVILGRV